jgi:hypothetical protein
MTRILFFLPRSRESPHLPNAHSGGFSFRGSCTCRTGLLFILSKQSNTTRNGSIPCIHLRVIPIY